MTTFDWRIAGVSDETMQRFGAVSLRDENPNKLLTRLHEFKIWYLGEFDSAYVVNYNTGEVWQ